MKNHAYHNYTQFKVSTLKSELHIVQVYLGVFSALASGPGLLRAWGPEGPKGPRKSLMGSILMLGLNPKVLKFHLNVSRKGARQRTLNVFLVICKNLDFRTEISVASVRHISLKFGIFLKPIKSTLLWKFHVKRFLSVPFRPYWNLLNLQCLLQKWYRVVDRYVCMYNPRTARVTANYRIFIAPQKWSKSSNQHASYRLR